jgi:WD40 repeat protein
LYYWVDALGLSGTPSSKWTSYQPFGCVDISSDGNEVVTGTLPPTPCGIHFWSNARVRPGPFEDETWTRHEGEFIMDVAISNDGSVIAASSHVNPIYKMYLYDSNGASLGEFELGLSGLDVSMSGDGSIVAAGGGGDNTLHVFKLPRIGPVGGTLISSPSINLLAFIGVSATVLTVLGVKLRRR